MDERMRELQRAWAEGDPQARVRYVRARARSGDGFPLEEVVSHSLLEVGPARRGYGVALGEYRRDSAVGMSPLGPDYRVRPWSVSEFVRARVASIRTVLGVRDDTPLRSLGDVLRVGLECFETQYDKRSMIKTVLD